jgi:hypothetical protein
MVFGHHDSGGHVHDDVTVDHHAGHDNDPSPAGAQHCAPCVACCATAAISCSAAIVLLDEHAVPVNAADPPSLAGIQPGALDRPPLAI